MTIRLPDIHGALFDLDGTLVDTEPLHARSTNVVLRPFGKHLIYRRFHRYTGWAEIPFWKDLRKRLKLKPSANKLKELRSQAYIEILKSKRLKPLPGALALLKRMRRAGIPRAIASSAPKEQIEANLRASGLKNYFSAVLSGHDDVRRGKPHPDLYLAAAKAIGVRAWDCAAFEDTATGLRSALGAGCFSVLIPRSYTVLPRGLKPNLRVRSFKSLTLK